MYLFLGQSTVIREREVIGVFDLDNASTSATTKAFLKSAQQGGQIVEVSPGELPKSFVVCVDKDGITRVYLSQMATATLRKRTKEQLTIES